MIKMVRSVSRDHIIIELNNINKYNYTSRYLEGLDGGGGGVPNSVFNKKNACLFVIR